MPEGILLPKFLKKGDAFSAIEFVVASIFHRDPEEIVAVKRKACHVVILIPSMKDERDEGYPSYPNYTIEPHLLVQAEYGREEWTAPYDEIAQCKALQLWHDRNDDRTDIMPHLLFPGDTPYWGGVKRHGIVVTCSGVQPYFDKMISGMIADMCIAQAYHAWMISEDKEKGVSFLS